jgi:hypothetical protein
MVGCGLERGSNDTRERCVVSRVIFSQGLDSAGTFFLFRGDADTLGILVSPPCPVTTWDIMSLRVMTLFPYSFPPITLSAVN